MASEGIRIRNVHDVVIFELMLDGIEVRDECSGRGRKRTVCDVLARKGWIHEMRLVIVMVIVMMFVDGGGGYGRGWMWTQRPCRAGLRVGMMRLNGH